MPPPFKLFVALHPAPKNFFEKNCGGRPPPPKRGPPFFSFFVLGGGKTNLQSFPWKWGGFFLNLWAFCPKNPLGKRNLKQISKRSNGWGGGFWFFLTIPLGGPPCFNQFFKKKNFNLLKIGGDKSLWGGLKNFGFFFFNVKKNLCQT